MEFTDRKKFAIRHATSGIEPALDALPHVRATYILAALYDFFDPECASVPAVSDDIEAVCTRKYGISARALLQKVVAIPQRDWAALMGELSHGCECDGRDYDEVQADRLVHE